MGVCRDELKKNGIKAPEITEKSNVKSEREYRKVPMNRLVSRLGLKKYDKEAPIVDADIKIKEYKVMLNQGIGAMPKLVVKKGDTVKASQLIAKYCEEKLGVSLHSPCDGKILEVTDKFVLIRA